MSPLFMISLLPAQAQTLDDPWGVKPPPPPPEPAPVVEEVPPPQPGSCAALFMADNTLNPWAYQLEEALSCDRLAEGVWSSVAEFQGEIPLDAVEPVHQAPIGLNGSLAQIQPAAAIQPVPLSGGGVGVVQGSNGPRLIAGLSVNPGALAASTASSYASASRRWDLSVHVPIELLNDSDRFDHVGMRVRRSLS